MSQRTVQKILDLEKVGYRSKVPGGNERMDSFAAFCALIKYDFLEGRWQILLIPYRNKTIYDVKNEEEKFHEVPRQAVYREVLEETNIILVTYRSLAVHSVEDTRLERKGEKFARHLYLSRNFDASNIRTKLSHSQPNIGIPFWADLDQDLLKAIAHEHIVFIDDILRRVSQFETPPPKKLVITSQPNNSHLAEA
ncbi:MAG: hypothetical protein V4478_03610 [Patescibacteria group bacterium]